MWNNTYLGQPVGPEVEERALGILKEGRDFFTFKPPGYVPLTYPHPLRALSPTRGDSRHPSGWRPFFVPGMSFDVL